MRIALAALLVMTLGCAFPGEEQPPPSGPSIEEVHQSIEEDRLRAEVDELRREVAELRSRVDAISELREGEVVLQWAEVEEPQAKMLQPEGICGRSPVIRDAILAELEMSACGDVTGEGLLRIAALDIGVPYLQRGDLDGLAGVTTLGLGVGSLPPGNIFRDMRRLERLKITMHDVLEPWRMGNLLAPMPMLESLDIGVVAGVESAGLVVDGSAFAGNPELNRVGMEGVLSLDWGALDGLAGLEEISIGTRADASSGGGVPVPENALVGLPSLRRLDLTGFEWPERLSLANYEVLCELVGHAVTGAEHIHLESVARQNFVDSAPEGHVMMVDGHRATVTDSRHGRCVVGLGDPAWGDGGRVEYFEEVTLSMDGRP